MLERSRACWYPRNAVLFIALVTIAGVGIGFAAALVSAGTPQGIGGRLRMLRIDHWPVLVLGVVLSLAVGLDTNMLAGRFALGISLALLLAGCLLNRHIAGACVAAVGIAANLAVLLVNGYMPIDPGAVVAAGIIESDGLDRVLLGAARRWSTDATIAAWLGGAIPLAPLKDVVTLGDVVTAAGLANIGFRLMWPAALTRQRLEAMPVVEAEDYDEASVVLKPASPSTTLEHPPMVGATAASPAVPAPAATPAPAAPVPGAPEHPAAPAVPEHPDTPSAPPEAAPAPVIHQPMWASRVEPAPWPAPAPWPPEALAGEPATPSPKADREPTELHRPQPFDA